MLIRADCDPAGPGWRPKYIPWSDLTDGAYIDQHTEAAIYELLLRLKEYEDTGYYPSEIKRLEEIITKDKEVNDD